MVLFCPIQQELDCISSSGRILGRIKFNSAKEEYIFHPDSESIVLSSTEESTIAERISGLNSGKYSISMQCDD